MSISKKLDETLENLDLTQAAQAARDTAISKSMSNLMGKMSDLDIEVVSEKKDVKVEVKPPRFSNRDELVDTARKVYRDNINP